MGFSGIGTSAAVSGFDRKKQPIITYQSLYLDIDCESGFEIHGEEILENGDLGNQPLNQRLIKLRDGGGLFLDEILQFICSSLMTLSTSDCLRMSRRRNISSAMAS